MLVAGLQPAASAQELDEPCRHIEGAVCGIDGNTYPNACAATAIPLAHLGPCLVHYAEPHHDLARSFEQTVLPQPTLASTNQSSLAAGLSLAGGTDEVTVARGVSDIRLRGLSGNHVLLLQDGLRVNHALMSADPGHVIGLIDVNQVESASILLGPHSAGFGSGALGGVVNVSSSIRTLRDSGLRGALGARFASAELEGSGSGSAEVSSGGASLRLGLFGLGTSDLRAGGGSEATTSGYHHLGGQLAFRIDYGRWAFEGLGTYSNQADLDTPADQSSLTGRSRSFNWVGFTSFPSHPRIDLAQVRLGLQHVIETRLTDGESWDLDGTMGQLTSRLETRFGEVLLGWDLDLVYEVLRTDGDDPTGEELATFRDGSTVITPSAGVRATVPMGASDFAMAARLDWRSAEVPSDARTLRLSELAPSASVSLTQHLADGLDGFIEAGTALSLPGLSRLFALERRDVGTFLPNSDLSAERSVGTDLGVDWRFEPLSVRVVAGYAYLFDWITVSETGELDPDNLDGLGRPLPYLRATNMASAHSFALETELALVLGHMLLSAQNDWMWTESVAKGTPLAGLPPLSGRVSLGYRGLDWSAGPYFRYAAAQTRGVPENRSTGHAIVGLRADAQFGWARVFVTLDNLSDARYRLHGSSVDGPGFNGTISVLADWY